MLTFMLSKNSMEFFYVIKSWSSLHRFNPIWYNMQTLLIILNKKRQYLPEPNGLPLGCEKKRKPKKSQHFADFYRFDFFASKKMEPIIGIDKEGKARRRAWTEQSEVKATDHQERIAILA